MSSDRRIQASRSNGSKSRGPTTPEGKQHSSGNATSHGLLSDCLVLPGELRAGFDALLAEYLARFGPRDGVELSIIEEMTACYWRMRRAWSIEYGLLKEGITTQTS